MIEELRTQRINKNDRENETEREQLLSNTNQKTRMERVELGSEE